MVARFVCPEAFLSHWIPSALVTWAKAHGTIITCRVTPLLVLAPVWSLFGSTVHQRSPCTVCAVLETIGSIGLFPNAKIIGDTGQYNFQNNEDQRQ